MAMETYASTNGDQVHADVLSQARLACYKVLIFLFLFSVVVLWWLSMKNTIF